MREFERNKTQNAHPPTHSLIQPQSRPQNTSIEMTDDNIPPPASSPVTTSHESHIGRARARTCMYSVVGVGKTAKALLVVIFNSPLAPVTCEGCAFVDVRGACLW
jgi:hypothetical protein